MSHEFDVQLHLARLNRSSRRLMLQRAWRVMLVMALALLLLCLLQFGWPWGAVAGVLGAVVLVAVVFTFLSHRISAMNARWVAISGGALNIRATAEWLEVRHDAVGMSIRWHALGPLIKLPEDWLLMMWSGNSYVPLPLEQVPEDALLFIEAEVAAHGCG